MIGKPENIGRTPNGRAVLKDLDDIPTEPIVVQDNRTAVLQGLQWPMRATANGEAKIENSNVIVLVRARRIFRTGDEEGRPILVAR